MQVSCWAVLMAGLTLAKGANAMYSAKSDVLQLNSKTFNQAIIQSNHTAVCVFHSQISDSF